MKKVFSVILSIAVLISFIPLVELNLHASAGGFFESESNNDYASADTLPLSSSISGKMDSSSDIDVYKISTTSNGKLSVSFHHTYDSNSRVYWAITIYQYANGQYNQLSSKTIYGSDNEIISLPVVGAIASGVYYVKVSTYWENTAGVEYSIANTFTATEYAEKEVNDSYSSATVCTLGQTYSGCMGSDADVDYYRLDTNKNGKLSLTFNHKNSNDSKVYWNITIYQYANGQYNQLSSKTIYGRDNEIISLPVVGAVASGVYYVKVSTYWENTAGVEYSIANTFEGTEYFEQEQNNTYDAANICQHGRIYSGCMNNSDDKDYYKLVHSSNEPVNIVFSHDTADDSRVYWYVKVYQYTSGSYTEVASKTVNGSNGAVDIVTLNTSGTYYVLISTYYENTAGYEYSVNFKVNDTTKPTGSITATNNVSTSQTVTLTLSDNIGVAGYYWGTSSSYANNTYTATSSASVTKTISSPGTYYFTVKDTSGNVSTTYSVTFYKTTLNANGGSVSTSYVLTKSGNSVTLPTPTKSGYTFMGWSTSSTATSGVNSITPTANTTYYAVWKTNAPTVKIGDVNGDGVVDAADAGLISRYDAGFIALTADQLSAGDVNGDGVVDAADAGLISRYDAGFISTLG
ncbi:MAG: InlB B-repeat-containing protein [Candidatus Fimenecus sp.]